jgi:hypothetical protein
MQTALHCLFIYSRQNVVYVDIVNWHELNYALNILKICMFKIDIYKIYTVLVISLLSVFRWYVHGQRMPKITQLSFEVISQSHHVRYMELET